MTVSCVIFDVDGTLSDCEHRTHWVRSNPKNWGAFNKAMAYDSVHDDIVWLLKTLHNAGCKILIATGRNEDERSVTKYWLDNVAGLDSIYERLYMRKSKDYRSDDVIKSEILDQMREDGYDPTMCVDDRNQVVQMWRARGLRCLQIAPGDF